MPSAFPQELEKSEVSYRFWSVSEGLDSESGRWAKGPTPDGKGEFEYLAEPEPMGEEIRELGDATPLALGTMKKPSRVTPPATTGMRKAAD